MDGGLAELILREREEIERRFAETLRRASAAHSLEHQTVVDSLQDLLEELVVALRQRDEPSPTAATSLAASEHGAQRYRLGYDVATLVREYGLLQEILFDLIEERSAQISLHELRILALTISNAVADSSLRYAHARDAEQQRQASQHIGFLAHELRDPLGAARLGITLLRQKESASPVLDSVERGLTRMTQLIDDALIDVRLRSSGQLHRESFPLCDLVEVVVEEASAAAQAKGIKVRSEIASRQPIIADQRVLRSAVSNLVRNAVKFSRPEGEVIVRAVDAGGRWRIEVEDSCGGLPEGAVETVFDPYVQLGKDKSGFGLGLAIAKQAAMTHDGEIRVHDLPGKGCVFVLDIPARPPPRRPLSA